MITNLLYIDECFSDTTNISSLTGLIIPVDAFQDLRSSLFKILPREEVHFANGKKISVINPPELHGSKFLVNFPGADDEFRVRTFEGIVEYILNNKLEIFRGGVHLSPSNYRKLNKDFPIDRKMYSVCWVKLLRLLEQKLANELVIPIMDGLTKNIVREFSSITQGFAVMKEAGWTETFFTNDFSKNVIGEVYYSDSKYSFFIQVTDVISYLRHIKDRANQGENFVDFKKELLRISEKLETTFLHEEIDEMVLE